MLPPGPELEQRLLDFIPKIKTAKQGSLRAPHKPLLLLLALGRVQRGEPRLVPYSQIAEKLRGLLNTYGRPRRGDQQPELPFWHLQTDGLWEIPGGDELDKGKGQKRPLLPEMKLKARGGFPEDIDELLRMKPELLRHIAHMLLDEHFPASYHEDLVTAVGLDLTEALFKRAKRDPIFRDQVLNAYGYRCAVCGLAPILDGMSTVLVEAAHLRWHSHGGPSTIENGICLCPLHHKGLDLGVIGISANSRVMISSRLHGDEVTEKSFGQYHLQPLRGPVHGHTPVRMEYVKWHTQEVFKKPARQ